MKITKNNAGIPEGTCVTLPSNELLIIKAICREPDGIYYRVQFVEKKGREYIPVGDIRVMGHYELIGATV